ncbi:hypothetical protein CAEBREN_32523 [Caenorhabditis brenneri]|uniref:Uncharacterized protein n=1 Tax=Caenorhabditis brenneri TaxID=135651 RepID=G0PGJ3_CAEBE|nr:hypothetical protein CAEBREN_32523 [Caenorhabditis brenneri]
MCMKRNGLDLSFGYSPWFSIAATILSCGTMLLAEYIANGKIVKSPPQHLAGPTTPSF